MAIYSAYFWLLASVSISGITANSNLIFDMCETPLKELGRCTIFDQCPYILKMLDPRPISPENRAYLRQSTCGFQGRVAIMCCSLNDYKENNSAPWKAPVFEAEETKADQSHKTAASTLSPLLPDPAMDHTCGYFNEERIWSNEVQLDGHPWTAILQYQNQTVHGFNCGGVLISNRYVLTAAHCVYQDWKLTSVRLGEQNIQNDLDCTETGMPFEFCSDPTIDVDIEEIIVHEEYEPVHKNHDIALLRLSRNVTFTEFLQPICLQSIPQKLKLRGFGEFAEAIGWGVSADNFENNKKRRTKIKLLASDECKAVFGKLAEKIQQDQLCTIVAHGEDFCAIDSGGVLIKTYESIRFAVGIMSSGPTPCTSTKLPLVYTNVQEHLPWIINKLKRQHNCICRI